VTQQRTVSVGLEDEASDRIRRFRTRFLKEIPYISIQRAKYYTEKWKDLKKRDDISVNEKVALAMKNVYENMDFCIDPDDWIVGGWTEEFLGIPIDIERGLYNGVFEIEFSNRKMRRFSLIGNIGFAWHKIKTEGLRTLLKSLKESKNVGIAMPGLGNDTIDKRKINPYQIKLDDKNILLSHLLPYWKNKTISDILIHRFNESGLYRGEFKDFINNLPRSTAKNDVVTNIGAALGVWQGHLILDHITPIKKGLVGMLDDVKNALEQPTLKPDELSFLKSIHIALEGVVIFSRRLAEKVKRTAMTTTDSERRIQLDEIAQICTKVPIYPPETFKEAIQAYWTIKTAVELAVPFNVHAPGRLDQIFYPYYMKDLQEGRITEIKAREILEELFLKIMSHNMRPYSNASTEFSQRYEGSEPVTLAGITTTGNDATNELTYLILDAADRSRASLNFVVRVHPKSPQELLLKVAELHSKGLSSVSIMNDEICIQTLRKRGFTQEDANNYGITGCVDMVAPGKTGGEGFSSMLMCSVLDLALRNGNTRTPMGILKNVGLKTGEPEDFKNFEQVLDAFFKQSDLMLDIIVKGAKIRDQLYAEKAPAPHISAFMQGPLESKKDITLGGAIYNVEGILYMCSIANTIDSLYVIKKLVFEQQKFTLRQLMDAVDHNYSHGYEWVREEVMKLKGKWGNGNPESDELAHTVTTYLFEQTYKYRTFKDGFFAPFINSMTTHTYSGRISIATPDGRYAGKPFAASCNPYNVEENGPTGVLRSVAALDYSHVMGCAVNIRMHPSGIGKTVESRRKWMSLIQTYFKLGGEQLQPTVVSTKMLRDAQKNPDQYQGLIIKVGGYSAYFVDLGKEIQDEIISRTEHERI
jgi:pyruvate-formate lyase